MDWLLYLFARSLVGLIQALPLRVAARLGRTGGAVAYVLDARHRRVAQKNLRMCFPEKSDAEVTALARENFRRLGENYVSAIKTASMTLEELRPHFDIIDSQKITPYQPNHDGPQSFIMAIGHFGNFELYARFGGYVKGYKTATTYRGLPQPSLNRLMQSLRERSGCTYYERRSEAGALKAAMASTGLFLGLLADQHAGDGGLRLPFFGHDCSTSAAPAVLALRYHCPLHTGICYRTGLAQWRIETGDEVPTRINGQARTSAEIMTDVNRAFEVAVRRDPANWFWVHNRWKPRRVKKTKPAPSNPSPQRRRTGNKLQGARHLCRFTVLCDAHVKRAKARAPSEPACFHPVAVK